MVFKRLVILKILLYTFVSVSRGQTVYSGDNVDGNNGISSNTRIIPGGSRDVSPIFDSRLDNQGAPHIPKHAISKGEYLRRRRSPHTTEEEMNINNYDIPDSIPFSNNPTINLTETVSRQSPDLSNQIVVESINFTKGEDGIHDRIQAKILIDMLVPVPRAVTIRFFKNDKCVDDTTQTFSNTISPGEEQFLQRPIDDLEVIHKPIEFDNEDFVIDDLVVDGELPISPSRGMILPNTRLDGAEQLTSVLQQQPNGVENENYAKATGEEKLSDETNKRSNFIDGSDESDDDIEKFELTGNLAIDQAFILEKPTEQLEVKEQPRSLNVDKDGLESKVTDASTTDSDDSSEFDSTESDSNESDSSDDSMVEASNKRENKNPSPRFNKKRLSNDQKRAERIKRGQSMRKSKRATRKRWRKKKTPKNKVVASGPTAPNTDLKAAETNKSVEKLNQHSLPSNLTINRDLVFEKPAEKLEIKEETLEINDNGPKTQVIDSTATASTPHLEVISEPHKSDNDIEQVELTDKVNFDIVLEKPEEQLETQ